MGRVNFRAGSIDPLPTAENVLSEDTSKVNITGTQPITQGVSGFYGMFDPSTYIAVSGSYSMAEMMQFSTINPMLGRLMERYPRNQWIARTEALWHIASNWSLGHVPTIHENVFFSESYTGTCKIYGDVHVHDFVIDDDCFIRIDVARDVTINAYSLSLGTRSNLNWANANVNVTQEVRDRRGERLARDRDGDRDINRYRDIFRNPWVR